MNDDGVEDEKERCFHGLTVADLWDPDGLDDKHKKTGVGHHKGCYVISSKGIDRVRDLVDKKGIVIDSILLSGSHHEHPAELDLGRL